MSLGNPLKNKQIETDKNASKAQETLTTTDKSNLNVEQIIFDTSDAELEIKETSGIAPIPDVQPMLDRYFEKEEKIDEPITLEQLSNDINQVLIKLDTLIIKDHPSQQIPSIKYPGDISKLKSAHSLMEIDHPDVLVEILEDGCRVTCITCKEYLAAYMHCKM